MLLVEPSPRLTVRYSRFASTTESVPSCQTISLIMFPRRGFNGGYHWIEADATDLEIFLRCCQQALVDRYLAVTAVDSGSFLLQESDLAAGWSSDGGIAFSTRTVSAEDLTVIDNQIGRCAAYNELYTFESPPKLGALYTGDVFQATICSNRVVAFANFMGFRFSAPEVGAITDLFWAQNGMDAAGIIHCRHSRLLAIRNAQSAALCCGMSRSTRTSRQLTESPLPPYGDP